MKNSKKNKETDIVSAIVRVLIFMTCLITVYLVYSDYLPGSDALRTPVVIED